jgi:hypothetical protein
MSPKNKIETRLTFLGHKKFNAQYPYLLLETVKSFISIVPMIMVLKHNFSLVKVYTKKTKNVIFPQNKSTINFNSLYKRKKRKTKSTMINKHHKCTQN